MIGKNIKDILTAVVILFGIAVGLFVYFVVYAAHISFRFENISKDGLITVPTTKLEKQPEKISFQTPGCPLLSDLANKVEISYPEMRKPEYQINTMIWKNSTKNPYIAYKPLENIELDIDGVPAGQITNLVVQEVSTINKATQIGTYVSQSFPYSGESSLILFSKDKKNYMARILGEESGSKLILSCGNIDQGRSRTYSDLFASSKRVSNWNSIFSQIYHTVISVEDVKDKVVYLNISGLEGGGGHLEYWTRQNNYWEKLIETQEYPSCKMFEDRKIGKGLECFDFNSGSKRLVAY